MTDKSKNDENQGEGNRAASRRYNKATRDYVESGELENTPDPAELPEESARRAEAAEKARAKELDPAVHRNRDEATKG